MSDYFVYPFYEGRSCASIIKFTDMQHRLGYVEAIINGSTLIMAPGRLTYIQFVPEIFEILEPLEEFDPAMPFADNILAQRPELFL